MGVHRVPDCLLRNGSHHRLRLHGRAHQLQKAYCVYSAAISLVVYPICGHWMWGGGWLQRMGFHDFAALQDVE